jgi:hypothetical protein
MPIGLSPSRRLATGSERHMRTTLAGLILLASGSVAQADYYFSFKQFDDAGAEVERGSWKCADVDTRADRCTQSVRLLIDDRPEPIEMRFHAEGGILRLTMTTGGWQLATKSSKPLIFGQKGVIASVIEIWRTDQRVETDVLRDLIFHPGHHLMATLTLTVSRSAAPNHP